MVSRYTPTIEEVRDAFAGHDFDQAITGAQFDRWLAEVERAAAEKAWDEGYEHNCNPSDGPVDKSYSNPYRRNEGESK